MASLTTRLRRTFGPIQAGWTDVFPLCYLLFMQTNWLPFTWAAIPLGIGTTRL